MSEPAYNLFEWGYGTPIMPLSFGPVCNLPGDALFVSVARLQVVNWYASLLWSIAQVLLYHPSAWTVPPSRPVVDQRHQVEATGAEPPPPQHNTGTL